MGRVGRDDFPQQHANIIPCSRHRRRVDSIHNLCSRGNLFPGRQRSREGRAEWTTCRGTRIHEQTHLALRPPTRGRRSKGSAKAALVILAPNGTVRRLDQLSVLHRFLCVIRSSPTPAPRPLVEQTTSPLVSPFGSANKRRSVRYGVQGTTERNASLDGCLTVASTR
jgi:hypothetical protein